MRSKFLIVIFALVLAACAPQQQAFRATVAPTRIGSGAPLYTETPTSTPTPSLSPTATFTETPLYTPTPTATPTITPTPGLMTLTPVSAAGAPPAISVVQAALSPTEGWTCGDFPCADDVEGFMRRIQVPPGFILEHVGRFPGQPMQITYGADGRLYATLLMNGTRNGAVYAMDESGNTEFYAGDFVSPVGLAFQPGTDVLYVSSRVMPMQGGALWRVYSDGRVPELVIGDLPCCFQMIDNQPNGITFGQDGYLYMGVGSVTDHGEPSAEVAQRQPYADILPYEASILRIQPHTGEIQVYAEGIRNGYDVTFDTTGVGYATDNGLLTGQGDRLVQIVSGGAHFGFPYWRARECEACPPTPANLDIQPDFVRFPNYTLPRGLVAYTATQFPSNYFDTLFVALWNGRDGAQRVVNIDPREPNVSFQGYVPTPFITGLIRPVDVVIAPDGSLVVADFIYGHVWRVRYQQ